LDSGLSKVNSKFSEAIIDDLGPDYRISVTEFLEGFAQIAEGKRLLRAYARVNMDSRVASQAAIFRCALHIDRTLIGDFDILIAATAVTERLPFVTRNSAIVLPPSESRIWWKGLPSPEGTEKPAIMQRL